MSRSKVVSLKEAMQEVRDGDTVVMGAVVEDRRPMAAAYELVRQGRKGLVVLAECSLSEDVLVGAGCVSAYRGTYSSIGAFGISPCIKRLSEAGRIVIDDIGHTDICLQAMAAMAGSPFIATRCCLGTDVLNPAFDNVPRIRELARDPGMIPARKYVLMEDPFFGEGTVVLQPALKADVFITHVQYAGEEGTVRIDGSLVFDHFAVHCAKKVIVTAEQVVPEEYLRRDPNRNQIPSTSVDMVVEVPWGGHPGQVYNFYDMDVPFMMNYAGRAKTAEGFEEWANAWIFGVKDHFEYLDKLGASRLEKLRAIPPYGYRPRVRGGMR
ncbi:MAG: CoA transferase subunit A [Firmicutes bacterium]|nr:CoA transferase subunit A [Bacillota bacterium]